MPIIAKINDLIHGRSSHNETESTPTSDHTTSTTTAATQTTADPTTSSTNTITKTEFDPALVTVVYVLGGPGAGKGTQCATLVTEYDFVHISAGDLLRAEQQREGSQYGQLIADYIREGKVVPMEVTIKLLENAMRASLDEKKSSATTSEGWKNGKGRFLIDGFPRKMDQALKFDETVCPASFVLFFNCPEHVLLERLLNRGKTSGRADDNEESIKKRFKTFVETSMPVVDYYREQGKVVEIDSTPPPEEVYQAVKVSMDATFAVKSVVPTA